MDDFGYTMDDFEMDGESEGQTADQPSWWQTIHQLRSLAGNYMIPIATPHSTPTVWPAPNLFGPSTSAEQQLSSNGTGGQISSTMDATRVQDKRNVSDNFGSLPPSSSHAPTSTLKGGTDESTVIVCTQCKPRKLNCDRRIPCGACRIRDCIDLCSYSDSLLVQEGEVTARNFGSHPFPPTVTGPSAQELLDRTISLNHLHRSSLQPSMSRNNVGEVAGPKSEDISHDTFLSWGSKDPAALADIDVIQTWLDSNLDHPDRQAKIRKLINYSLEHDDYLPRSIFIDGVKIGGDGTPVAGGSFADVYQGTWNGHEVAIKQFRRFMEPDGRDKLYKRFCREAITWRQLRHPRVLPFLGIVAPAFSTKGSMIMVSPWMPKGTLMEYLAQPGTTVEHLTLIKDMASGLGYLHGQSFAHGDIHGSNVFVDEYHRATLGDFGLTSVTDLAQLPTTTTINRAGAVRWLAPELIHQDDDVPPRKTTEGDIFAFGRLCLCIYTRRLPYHSITSDVSVLLRVIMHRHPSKPTQEECHGEHMAQELWDLILSCWDSDPVLRPSIVDIESRLAASNAEHD